MANRYWVGGTGTWNGTSTTNWSTATGLSFTASCTSTVLTTTGSPALVAGMTVWSSTFVSLGTVVSGSANTWVVSVGGTYASQGMSAATVGASVPTSADNVFFDANSNSSTTAFTVTMATVAATCANFDASAVDGVMTLAGTVALDVYGSLSLPALSLFTRSYTGTTTFRATTTGKTINTNGRAFGGTVTFDGVGGGWTATSALTTSSAFNLTNGSLDLGGFTVTGFNFSSNNSNTRTLAFNGGTYVITGSASTSTQTLWNVVTATGLTVTGTPTVNVINNSTNSGFTRAFSHGTTAGGSEANSVNLNIKLGDVGSLISLAGTFKNLDFTGCSSTLNNATRFIYGDLTFGSGMTLTAGTSSINFTKTSGTQFITSAALTLDFPITFGYSNTTTAATGDGTTATLTFSASTQCPSVGSTIIVSGVTPAGYNGTYTITASTNTTVSYANATTGAQTVAGTFVNGGSTTYTLQDALSVGTATNRSVTLHTGTLNLAGFTLTNFGAFSSNNSNTRSIAFGAGNYTNTSTVTATTVWGFNTATNFTYTGTPTVNISGNLAAGNARTIQHANTAGGSETNSPSFNITAGSDAFSLSGYGLDVNTTGFSGSIASFAWNMYGNLTFSSTTTITGGTSVWSFLATSGTQIITSNGVNLDRGVTFTGTATYRLVGDFSVGISTNRTVTFNTGTLDLNNNIFTIFGVFSSSSSTNVRAIAFGTSGKFVMTSSNTTLWSAATVNTLTITGTNPLVEYTANASTGSRLISVSSTGGGESTAISFNITAGTDTISNAAGGRFKNLNLTGFLGTLANDTRNIFGDLTLPSGITITGGTNTTTFTSTNATVRTITTNSNTLDFPITFNGVGGSWRLQDALTVGNSRNIGLTNGSFDTNTKSLTCGTFNFSNTNTKTLTLGTSTVTITGGTSTSGFVGAINNTTYDVANSTIVFTTTGSTVFAGGSGGTSGTLFGTITMSGLGGTLYLGNSTGSTVTVRCATLNNTVSPCTITNSCTTAFTVTNFNVNGTAGNLVVLNSDTAGTARTITKASGTTDVDYLNIQDSTATGGTWTAYNSTNSGNNTGWLFNFKYDASTTIASTSTVDIVARATYLTNSQITGTSAVSSNGVLLKDSSFTIAGTSLIDINPIRIQNIPVAIAGTSLIFCTGIYIYDTASTIAGTSLITDSAVRVADMSSTIAGTSDFTSAGLRYAVGSFTIEGISLVDIQPRATYNQGITIEATSLVDIKCAYTTYTASTLTATSSITVNATRKWDDEPAISETWSAVSDVSESWTDVSSNGKTWTPASTSSNSWTTVSDNPEIWTTQ